MRKLVFVLLLAWLTSAGCASDYDRSRQFWDQTSDNPFR